MLFQYIFVFEYKTYGNVIFLVIELKFIYFSQYFNELASDLTVVELYNGIMIVNNLRVYE